MNNLIFILINVNNIVTGNGGFGQTIESKN